MYIQLHSAKFKLIVGFRLCAVPVQARYVFVIESLQREWLLLSGNWLSSKQQLHVCTSTMIFLHDASHILYGSVGGHWYVGRVGSTAKKATKQTSARTTSSSCSTILRTILRDAVDPLAQSRAVQH